MSLAHGERAPATAVISRRSAAVWSFLGLFAICGVFGFELWPLTGWRLFANLREQQHVTWVSEVTFADGSTGGVPLHGAGADGTPFVMGRLNEYSVDERNRLCAEWLTFSPNVRAITIYRSTSDLARRDGDRGAPPSREPAYICESDVITSVHA